MISLFSYLLTFFGVIFWGFRAWITLMCQMGQEMSITPINVTWEIGLLFATIPCMALIFRRNLVAAAIYFAMYATYFGDALFQTFVNGQASGLDTSSALNVFCALIGILIPLLTFIDVLVNKNRKLGSGDRKSDWFYKNEEYDRKFDERADRNQYKF